MWFSHLGNLLLRSWNATTAGYGTTTLGFILWVVLCTVLLWFAGVLGTWITLRRKKVATTFKEVLRDSLMALRYRRQTDGVQPPDPNRLFGDLAGGRVRGASSSDLERRCKTAGLNDSELKSAS